MGKFDLNLIDFDSIFFGGTGWNLAWQIGATKKLMELGFDKKIKKIGTLSGGIISGLIFCRAANYNRGLVQAEQLMTNGYFLSKEFRKRYKYYFEHFINSDPLADIKNSGAEFYASYVKLNNFPKLEFIMKSNFIDKNDLIDTGMAGCYIPLILGIEPNKIGLPILQNGDIAIDGGLLGSSIFRWSEKTLVISPSQKSNYNTIGANYNVLATIGIRSKNLSNKKLFMEGYSEASKWFAEYYLHDYSWSKESEWEKNSSYTYEQFINKNYKSRG